MPLAGAGVADQKAIADVLRPALPAGSKVEVLPQAGGIGNARLVAQKKADFAFSFSLTNQWAFQGRHAYDQKLDMLRGVAGGMDTYYLAALVRADSGIETMSMRTKSFQKPPITACWFRRELSMGSALAVAGTPFQRELGNAFERLEKMLSPRMRQFLDRLPSLLVAKPGPHAPAAAGSDAVHDLLRPVHAHAQRV